MASNVHVLVAALDWPPETFLARLLEGLLDEGIEITVACRGVPSSQWRRKTGFHWIYAPGWDGSAASRALGLGAVAAGAIARSPGDLRRLASLANGSDAAWWNRMLPFTGRRWSVIYIPWNGSAAYYRPLFQMGAPVVVSCRGSQVHVTPHEPSRKGVREAMAETFRDAAVVHCVSNDIRDSAAEFGVDPDKAVVIRPAVDPALFSPAPAIRRTSEFTVLTTGSLNWRKGYEYAVLAIRKLKDRGIVARYRIIGDGPDRQRIRYTVADLDLEDRVELLGRRSTPQVIDELRRTDVFLLSSLTEGISNAVIEAMSCEVPVVTTNAGGIDEAVANGEEGYVVGVRDADALAAGIERLFPSPEARQEMGRKGRARVLADFRLADQAARFADVFRSIAA